MPRCSLILMPCEMGALLGFTIVNQIDLFLLKKTDNTSSCNTSANLVQTVLTMLKPWLCLLIRNFIFVTIRIKPTRAFEDAWIYYIIKRCIPPTCFGNLLWPSSRRCFCEEYITKTTKPTYFHRHIHCTFSQQRHASSSRTPPLI
jgi:hypothetical protein